MSFFKPRVSFPLNFASSFSAMTYDSSETFKLKHVTCFGQKEPVKVQFFRILSALMKVHPIPQAIFETLRSGFIQIFNHCSVSLKQLFLIFLAQILYKLYKLQVSFSLNFAPFFSFMRDLLYTFYLKLYMIWTTRFPSK